METIGLPTANAVLKICADVACPHCHSLLILDPPKIIDKGMHFYISANMRERMTCGFCGNEFFTVKLMVK